MKKGLLMGMALIGFAIFAPAAWGICRRDSFLLSRAQKLRLIQRLLLGIGMTLLAVFLS